MDSTVRKIERLRGVIGEVPPDELLARLDNALEEVGVRLREYVGESTRSPEPPARVPDLADWMGQEARRIGHDLNNCLGVVGGRAELMSLHLDRGKLDDVRRGIEVVLGQMQRMQELTEELRALRHGPTPDS